MSKSRPAFTLIELLIVIAVLAILLSILAPTFSRLPELARRVLCGSKLRYLGVATISYVRDYQWRLPTAASNSVYTYYSWGGKAGYEYTATVRLINPYVSQLDPVSFADPQYVSDAFHCPDDSGATAGGWGYNRLPTMLDAFGSSYFYNSSADNNSDALGLFDKSYRQILNPDRVVMANCWPFNCHFWNLNPFQFSYWHEKDQLGWANVLFTDGHVRFLRSSLNNPDFQHGPDWTFVFNH